MYEESRVVINWKSVIIKFLILVLLVVGILFFYKYKHSSNVDEIMESNIVKLKDAAFEYYSDDNIIDDKLNERITLKTLIDGNKISKLFLNKNTKCDEENSFIKIIPSGNQYEIEVYLKCGDNTKMLNAYKAKKVTTTATTTTTKKTTSKVNKQKTNNNSKAQNKTTEQKYYTSVVTTEKKWAIVFDSRGGSSVNSQYLSSNEKPIVPVNPVKNGYRFDGWYYNDTPYNFDSPLNNNIIVYAKWVAIN